MKNSLHTLINSNTYSPIDIFLQDRNSLKEGLTFSFNTGLDQRFNLFQNLSTLLFCTNHFLNSSEEYLETYFKKIKKSLTVFPDETISIEIFLKKKHHKKELVFNKDLCFGKLEDVIFFKINSFLNFPKAFNEIEIHLKLKETKEYDKFFMENIDAVLNKFSEKNIKLKNHFLVSTMSEENSDFEEYSGGYFSIYENEVIEHLKDSFLSIQFYEEYIAKNGYVSKQNFKQLIESTKQRTSLFKENIISLEKFIEFNKNSFF